MSGKVILVGAGPGDPGLFTIKGLESLLKAEVVVYDRLVGERILALIPENAECIDVGKESANHKVPQDEINRILLRKAQEGKFVVRLKGGDPFVFGRGGEELELLRDNNIPFEVVPGITSAISAPSYAGIPVTHRDFCSSVHIITGHAREGKELEIDFDALKRTGGTLVFLMGVSAMPKIIKGLIDCGMDKAMPAAMVERGTTPKQRRVIATLETLPEKAAEAKIKSPAIIIVGKVCTLSDGFCWFEIQPLLGESILVTRPKERSGTLASRLSALGADVTEYPCIETVPITPCPDMEKTLTNINDYEWLCFTSPAGVDCMWKTLQKMGKDARALANVKLAVIGSGTAKAMKVYGLTADLIPEIFDAENLGKELASRAKGKVLILRAEIGSAELTKALSARNIEFDDIAVYQTIYENEFSSELREKIDNGDIMSATFTSASTVKGFVSSVGEDAPFANVTGYCIGRQTAEEAQKYGIKVKIAKKATIDALLELVKESAGDK